jgi:hypothetical protein
MNFFYFDISLLTLCRIISAMRQFSLLFLLAFCLVSVHYIQGQSLVDLSYSNKPLVDVLADLEKKHQLRFSYSQNKLELKRGINIYLRQKTLDVALKSMFEQNNISFTQIGQQWVLKNAPKPEFPKKKIDKPITVQTVTSKIPELELPLNKEFKPVLMDELQSSKLKIEPNNVDFEQKTLIQSAPLSENKKDNIHFLQFSPLGNSKTNSFRTNHIGISLLWGVHGSSKSVELAVMGSVLRKNMQGFQCSGIFNSVGINSNGFQLAGIMNSTTGKMKGLQISGLFNYANEVSGIQISPGFNMTSSELDGFQLAGIGNISGNAAKAAQSAFGFNLCKGNANVQLSGFYNKTKKLKGIQLCAGINEADESSGVQMGFVNRAKMLKGVQMGFINFADTVEGVSLGFINIVRAGGYNKIEASLSESMHVLFSLKIGSRNMYQICQGGFNLKGKAWGLGWGLGSVFHLNKKWQINSEAVLMHINEDTKWNPVLNLNTQLKTGFEYKLDKDFSLYLGPTANFMLSRYKDRETGIIGSAVPMYSIVDHTNRYETNFRFWVGLQTGMRMRLW